MSAPFTQNSGHALAHGDMSLHSVGVEKSSVVRLIDTLTQQVLELCESEFDLICERVALLPIVQSESVESSA